ncbi:antitoxin [Salmonella enterica subsp. enterica serovar Offa]|nr:antitoxin [Salmonella enterica subsp. enterica serovar Offa]
MAIKQRATKSVTMTVERVLLSRAREAGINLSATLTAALDVELRRYEAKKWSRIQRVDGISNVILSLNESPNDLVMHAG